jgi:hypothetical protein
VHGVGKIEISPVASLTSTRSLRLLDELRVPYAVAPRVSTTGAWHEISAGRRPQGLHWATAEDQVPRAYTLGATPIWGRVAPDSAVAEYVARLDGDWRRSVSILAPDGERHSSVWQTPEGGTLVPFDPDELIANLRSERYRDLGGGLGRSLARRGYYAVKPVLPHRLQIALRRSFARVQRHARFPRWPVEPALHDLTAFVLGRVADAAGEPVPYLAPWPAGREWALVLTHDVETGIGRDGIGRLRAVEEAAGYRSSWNLVPERYRVDDALVADLQNAGNEVGVHGLRHDGRDLGSLEILRERLPAMQRWAKRWGAVGFRSPATHRRWEWMPMLGFDYDSSYPDTDPYEPMPGGCCSWLPFFNQDQVELPITLPQDHTLFVILRRDDRIWHQKAEVLRARGGMALLIVHPDYMLEEAPLSMYENFLNAYRDDETAWKALPREVSAWWRARAATSIQYVDGSWSAIGPAATTATVAFVAPGTET